MEAWQLRIAQTLNLSAMALAFAVAAQAGANRTFVSTTGEDANTSANCSPSAPCRTFSAALSVTNPGGELVVLTSGGYGPATITQPVVITAIGVDASISVTTSGADTFGLAISTPGNVTLIGLSLHGEGMGVSGILVEQVGFLRLYNMLIENFTSSGVLLAGSSHLLMYSSAINDNTFSGLTVDNSTAYAYVSNTSFDHNGRGTDVFFGQATVTDSSAEYNGSGFLAEAGGSLTLYNDTVAFNGTGLVSDTALFASGGTLYIANCLIANNTMAYSIDSSSTLAGTNPGTSFIGPGQSTSGTLSTPVTLR